MENNGFRYIVIRLLCITLLASCSNPSSEPSGRIAFLSTRDGNFEVYVINADGTGLKRLTNTSDDECCPVWSPDGSRLAWLRRTTFTSNCFIVKSIHVLEWETGAEAEVLNCADTENRIFCGYYLSDFGWSCDGECVALKFQASHHQYLYLETSSKNLPPGDSPCLERTDWDINLSSAGLQVEFCTTGKRVALDEGIKDVIAQRGLEIGSGTEFCLGDGHVGSSDPESERIAFTAVGTDGNVDIYIVNHLSREIRRLTTDPSADGNPSWSPVP